VDSPRVRHAGLVKHPAGCATAVSEDKVCMCVYARVRACGCGCLRAGAGGVYVCACVRALMSAHRLVEGAVCTSL